MTNKTTTRSTRSKAATTRTQKTDEAYKTVEYVAKNSGAVFMLMQSGITVFDEESGIVREIRYCERENSIYRDEQSERSVKSPIIFRMGRLFVTPDKPNLINFLDSYPGNVANGGNKFERVDLEKKAEVSLDSDFLMADAIMMVRTKELDDLMSVAMAFGIDTDRPVSEIKHDLMIKAKKSPKVFIDSFDNPVVAMKAKIKQAESFNIISLFNDRVAWFDTGKMIISVPAGQDPTDVFVRYCLTEAASPVVAEIDNQLKN
jgi:hypothetical protein